MNIIEQVKKTLSEYKKISDFSGGVHIDFTESEPANFGLSSIGDTLLKEDILGNQIRKHSFVLYAINQSFTDYDRLANSTFLLELSYWLQTLCDIPITAVIGDKEYSGSIKRLSSANGMIFDIPTGDINNGVAYQIQIYAEYKIIITEE